MLSTLRLRTNSATLVFSLALGWSGAVSHAQTSGPGLSSGTGQGTGAGGRTGILPNRSGSMSGVGPPANQDILRGRPVPILPGYENQRRILTFGPGVDVTFPNDPYLIPFMSMEEPGSTRDRKGPPGVSQELLKDARLIATPEERSLALQRIANGAIASNQLNLAHKTLEEAVAAAAEVTTPLLRDQRLIAIVTSLNFLAVALLREDNLSVAPAVPADADAKPEALPQERDKTVLIRMARLEWQRGVYLASIIDNPTYRNEMLYAVAESEASGSVTIANEYTRVSDADSAVGLPAPAEGTEPGKTPAVDDQSQKQTKPATTKSEDFKKLADAILVDSFADAKKIDRLIWKYRAMVRIALLAADSQQYSRGIELARGIENGESRAEAMLILAESQCRPGVNQNESATIAYAAAAEAIATIHQDGLRGVLTGFLIDSLISTGRFEDARACVVIYPELSQKLVALGAVAEHQGRRGAAEAARRWIANEIPEQYRPTLYRRVVTGELWTIEQNRSKEIPGEVVTPTQ